MSAQTVRRKLRPKKKAGGKPPAHESVQTPEADTTPSSAAVQDYRLVPGEGYRLKEVLLSSKAQAEIDAVLASVQQLPASIARDAHEPLYIDALAEVKDLLARLEDAREKVKRPFFEAGKLIDACARASRAPLEEAERRVSGELGRVEGVRRRMALDEQRRLEQLATENYLKSARAKDKAKQEEFAFAGASAQREAAEAVKPTEGLSIRLGWRAELVDTALVFSTNPQLLSIAVRQSSLNDLIRSLEERREAIGPDTIPGLRLFPITSVGVRGVPND
jgi:hypothetical protein